MKWIIKAITRVGCQITRALYSDGVTFIEHARAFLVVTGLASIGSILLVFGTVDISRVNELKNYRPPLPSRLLDRKNRLISTYFDTHRILLRKEDVTKHLIQAFIATEDNHFYSHFGIDPQAILRAFLINLQAGGVKQGGSTITQQLAKVILTSQKRTYIRKAKEAVLSLYMELILTKEEILNLYFNQIYFGHGNYGVEAAARFYFSKSAKELRVGECAILASLPSAPSGYSPIKNPHRSRDRMSNVLMKMVDSGFIDIATAVKEFREMQDTYYATLNMSPSENAFGHRIDHAPYFTETLRQILLKEVGKELLYNGGLTIQSSLDLDHQKAAQAALWPALKSQNLVSREYIFTGQVDFARKYTDILGIMGDVFDLPEFRIRRSFEQYEMQINFHRNLADDVELLNLALGGEGNLDVFLTNIRSESPFLNRYMSVQGALVEVDQKTGEVTAMEGGLPFSSQNQINRTMQIRRQPGSSFKPLIYAGAMEAKKITPATIFPDSPIIFLDSEGGSWMPENYSGDYKGFITVRQALAASANLVSVAVAREAGLSNILPTVAKQLHVKQAAIPYNLSVALGTYDVNPLQMANAFAIFPRGGKDLNVKFLHKITDAGGKVIRDFDSAPEAEPEQILSTATATVMTSLLQSVVHQGTGGRARYGGFAAGKTGTTQNFRDAWFVGFNKRYTAAVWIGYDRPSLSLGPGQAGGNIAAPVWGSFMGRTSGVVAGDEPYLIQGGTETVKICKLSGKRPGEHCTQIEEEIIVPGSLPEEPCQENHGAGPVSIPGGKNRLPGIKDENTINEDDI